MSDRLLTSEELAEALNVSLRTIKNWLSAGVIPAAIHEGKTLRFDLAAVKRALAKRAAKARKPTGPLPDMVPTY